MESNTRRNEIFIGWDAGEKRAVSPFTANENEFFRRWVQLVRFFILSVASGQIILEYGTEMLCPYLFNTIDLSRHFLVTSAVLHALQVCSSNCYSLLTGTFNKYIIYKATCYLRTHLFGCICLRNQ